METYLSLADHPVIFLSLVDCTVDFLLFSSLYITYSESLYVFKHCTGTYLSSVNCTVHILSSVDCIVINLQHSKS